MVGYGHKITWRRQVKWNLTEIKKEMWENFKNESNKWWCFLTVFSHPLVDQVVDCPKPESICLFYLSFWLPLNAKLIFLYHVYILIPYYIAICCSVCVCIIRYTGYVYTYKYICRNMYGYLSLFSTIPLYIYQQWIPLAILQADDLIWQVLL